MREVINICNWCGFLLEDWELEHTANYNHTYCTSCVWLPEFEDSDDFPDYDREWDMED